MPNAIPARQNEPDFLRTLYANSQAYAYSKYWSGWATNLAIIAGVSGPTIAGIYPDAAIVGAFLAVVVAVVDIVFWEPATKHYQYLGAKLQEAFDTDLFEIPWNNHRVGDRPLPEEIFRLAEEFKSTASPDAIKKKEDWYPANVGPVPLDYARLICQRASMRWDASLRKYYAFWFLVAVVVLAFAGVLYGAIQRISFIQFVIAVFAPLSPAAIKLLREMQKHKESEAASERARLILETFWEKAIKQKVPAEVFVHETRRLQDELFDRRKLSPTVPDWLYFRLRDKHEQEMKYGSQKMVDEVLAKVKPPAAGS